MQLVPELSQRCPWQERMTLDQMQLRRMSQKRNRQRCSLEKKLKTVDHMVIAYRLDRLPIGPEENEEKVMLKGGL